MPRERIWALIWLGGAIGALVLLAAGLPRLTFAPGHLYDFGALRVLFGGGASARAVDPASLAFWQAIIGAIWLGLLAFLAAALIVSADLRRELLRRLLLALAAITLVYLLLALLRALPGEQTAAPQAALPTPPPAAAEPFPSFDPQPAPWLVAAIGLLAAALLIVAIWLAWRRARAERAERPASALLADEAQAAAEGIAAGADPRDAVLRCYREMGRILGESRGVARAPSATPREFEAQLAAAGLRDEHIRRLTRLFERVRYGSRHADAAEEHEAIECLTAIARAYGGAQ